MNFLTYKKTSRRFALVNWTAFAVALVAGQLFSSFWPLALQITLLAGIFLGHWIVEADRRDLEAREFSEQFADMRARWDAADAVFKSSVNLRKVTLDESDEEKHS